MIEGTWKLEMVTRGGRDMVPSGSGGVGAAPLKRRGVGAVPTRDVKAE